MIYIELFGGIGGFSEGIKRAANDNTESRGQEQPKPICERDSQHNTSQPYERQAAIRDRWECIYYNEWDRYAVQTYNKNFKTKWNPSDITKVHAKDIPEHDILCAGFPCQSFSVAGKRKGFNDTRGTMFFEICRIAEYHRTPFLLLENVKGLLSHDEGRTMGTILKSLSELGYDAEWQVLNSKHFGVPQNRERIFILCSRNKSGSKIFPIGQSIETDIKQDKELPEQISNTLRSNYSSGYSNETYAYCIDANYWKGTRNPEKKQRTMIIDTNKVRRLTPIECERLQGFPDNWTAGVSDTQRYKQLGNAVTVNVIEAIIRKFGKVVG